jgi:ATP-binding cassette, subfamily B, bacterial PglK
LNKNETAKSIINKLYFMDFLTVLNKQEKQKYFFYIVIQVVLSILDLIGLGLISILGVISINNLQSTSPNSRIDEFLVIFNLEDTSLSVQLLVIGGAATGILMLRTVFSVVFMKKLLLFLSRKCNSESANLISKFMNDPKSVSNQVSTQSTLFALTDGMEALVVYILGGIASIVSDVALLIVLTSALLIVDPILGASTLVFFSTVGMFLYLFMHRNADLHGRNSAQLRIERNEKVVQVVGLFKEIYVQNQQRYYEQVFRENGNSLATSMAGIRFLPYVGKYVIESAIILGAVFIGAIQFVTTDAQHAAGALTAFLVAGARIAPAILRLQQSFTSLVGNRASATKSLLLIKEISSSSSIQKELNTEERIHNIQEALSIKLEKVSFQYRTSEKPSINEISLEIRSGAQIAIAGASGSGKTTLIDLIIGIHEPTSGKIQIGGMKPLDLIQNQPGIISYMTQDAFVINGTIRENICANLKRMASDQEVLEVIEKVNLQELVEGLPEGLDHRVGEDGKFLSGGQRQRLGLARAMISKPKLLVLDEGTSALDAMSENVIMESINLLRGSTTVIIVAHRLSSIMGADQILYLVEGKLAGTGIFDELRGSVPEFNDQVTAMGL